VVIAAKFGYRFYNPDSGRWLNRDPLGESGGKNLFSFALNFPTGAYDTLGESASYFNCQTSHMHRHVSGGVLAAFGVAYDETVRECDCCDENGATGKYFRRDASATLSFSVGLGFSLDFGTYTWRGLTIALEFDLQLTGPGIDVGGSMAYVEDDCSPRGRSQDFTVCLPFAFHPTLQTIGVGNRFIGLFGSFDYAIRGQNCLTLYSGKNPSPRGRAWGWLRVTGGVQVYASWLGDRHYLINEPVPPDRQLLNSYDITF